MLDEDIMALDEIVVIGYGTQKKSELTGAVSSIGGSQSSGVHQSSGKYQASRSKPAPKVRGTNSIVIPTNQVEKQTYVDFEIKTPYTVKSDNQSYGVDMVVYDLPAGYQYLAVPKISSNVYLMAHIAEWEKYNLMEGEANIFFEDTYIGKTLLDVRYAADTLHISLGRDKNVVVNREKIKDFTSKRLIGNKKKENRAYAIHIKEDYLLWKVGGRQFMLLMVLYPIHFQTYHKKESPLLMFLKMLRQRQFMVQVPQTGRLS